MLHLLYYIKSLICILKIIAIMGEEEDELEEEDIESSKVMASLAFSKSSVMKDWAILNKKRAAARAN